MAPGNQTLLVSAGESSEGGEPLTPPSVADPTTIYLVDKPGAAQSVIRAAHASVPRSDDGYEALTLLNFCFGGQFSARLNQNLRQDKGYSYGYNSGLRWFRDASLLLAGGSVQTAVTKESVQETLKEFEDIHADRPVTGEELDAAKTGLMLGYPAGFERPGQLLGQLINILHHDLPDDYFQSYKDRMTGVSLADVHRAGQEKVRPHALKVLVVGDRAEVEPGLRALELPVVLLDMEGAEVG